MSQRQTVSKPVSLLAIGGVNQRDEPEELPLDEYSNVLGVFPEFAGLQAKVYGKRLLAVYPDPIYGIHQFWTPYGYGGGLYQFDDLTSFGTWVTPTQGLKLTVPPLSIDAGGMTQDEFGYPYGSNFGSNSPNTCSQTFLSESAANAVCLPALRNIDTPDDSNGGPAGQGKKCAWVTSSTALTLHTYITGAQYGNDTGDASVGTIPPIAYPVPMQPIAPPALVVITPPPPDWATYTGVQWFRQTYAVVTDARMQRQNYGGIVTFNFESLKSNPAFSGVELTLNITISTAHNVNVASTKVLIIDTGDFDLRPHFPSDAPVVISASADGYLQRSFGNISIKALYRNRVCA